MAEVYDVILHNEGEGTPILYDVRAANVTDALAEAWRQYRELPYVDDEAPPEWTRPILQAALLRPNGEKPTGPYAPSRRRWGDDCDVVRGLSPEAIRPYADLPPVEVVAYKIVAEDANNNVVDEALADHFVIFIGESWEIAYTSATKQGALDWVATHGRLYVPGESDAA